MQWIKSNVHKPEEGRIYFAIDENEDKIKAIFSNGGWVTMKQYPVKVDRWLDESSPSFSLQDMIDAYDEGSKGITYGIIDRCDGNVVKDQWFLAKFNIKIDD